MPSHMMGKVLHGLDERFLDDSLEVCNATPTEEVLNSKIINQKNTLTVWKKESK